MGLLSKISSAFSFKGVKKVFKKIGKELKNGLKSFGKFMDKIGIVGQIGLALLLPGIGAAMSGMWGSLIGGMQAYAGVGSSIINGAGSFLNAATQFAGKITTSFNSITSGVKNVIGETLKAGANKLGLGNVATTLGEKLGSEYLTNLGSSISEANLTSIGETFNSSVNAVMESFSGDAFGADSLFETARREAAGIPEPQIEVTPDLDVPDIPTPAAGTAPDIEVIDVTAEGVPAISDAVTEPVSDSLLSQTTERATQFIKDLPETTFKAAEKGLQSSVVSGIRQATGVEQAPVYTQTSYATIVPTIQEAPMVGAPSMINPIDYMSNNQMEVNTQPFGYNAVMYNNATYLNAMQKYGFA